jgi:hypothetical protein
MGDSQANHPNIIVHQQIPEMIGKELETSGI